MTGNVFSGILFGALVTAAVQSSSATTVIVVGLVNAGLLKLKGAVGIIMGANIGTTMTTQILRLTNLEGDSSGPAILQLCKPSNFSSILIVIGLSLFINKTKSGRAMLAVSEDKDAAQLMGININRTISLTFAIGSGLAAIAGALLCSAYPTLQNTTGAMPGIKAFVAAVFGGIGSVPGAMIGGILIGVIEILGRAYISPQLADAIVFAVLILVLIIKPTGILGKKISEKV